MEFLKGIIFYTIKVSFSLRQFCQFECDKPYGTLEIPWIRGVIKPQVSPMECSFRSQNDGIEFISHKTFFFSQLLWWKDLFNFLWFQYCSVVEFPLFYLMINSIFSSALTKEHSRWAVSNWALCYIPRPSCRLHAITSILCGTTLF